MAFCRRNGIEVSQLPRSLLAATVRKSCNNGLSFLRPFSTGRRLRAGEPESPNTGSVPIKYEELQGPMRWKPASPSYYTANEGFFDNWVALQALLRKYATLPTVPAAEAPRPAWKSLSLFRSLAGSGVSASRYKKITNILNRLNRIRPDLVPEELDRALDNYRRPPFLAPPVKQEAPIDDIGRAYASGARKESKAQVWVLEGDGRVLVNGRPFVSYFKRLHDRETVIWPLKVSNRTDKYDIYAMVKGGGTTGQAEAITLGVAKALLTHEPLLKPVLRRAGCITRDPRTVERKKHGKLKARKMPAWVKR